jgi:hypothetical chaperone protein
MSAAFVPEIYAIDFGTTNSLLAAASRAGIHAPIMLDEAAQDTSILRSVLYFPHAERCFYGARAIAEYTASGGQGRLIRSIKKHLPSRSFIGTFIDERPMNLEDLIGAFLSELRVRADHFFGAQVTRVVLGRPARFAVSDADDTYAQNRLERAARIAGFTDISFCPEPIAAAREFRSKLEGEQIALVGDFGGGTSDFTVLRMHKGAFEANDVLAIGGLSVAGDAFDSVLMRKHVGKHFGTEVTYRVPLGSNEMKMPPALMEKICTPADASLLQSKEAMTFLRNVKDWSLGPDDERALDQLFTFVDDRLGFSVFEAIEQTKRALSSSPDALFQYRYADIAIDQAVERHAFEQNSQRATGLIVAELDATLARAQLTPDDVHVVCCTGGTARLPAVENALAQRFGRDKLTQFENFHSVIKGLSEHARSLL